MRTVGVEEELLLVDPATGEPKALSTAVLARAAHTGSGDDVFEEELHQQQLEFATHPQSDMRDIATEIVRCRKEAARLAGEFGASVVALGTSPLPAKPAITVNNRYAWMVEQFGLPTQEQLVCGCHVHVSVESDEEGVAVIDRIRPWLPILTALSANSPFWYGKDSHYDSYRNRVWERWPSAGPTELFGSAEMYHRRVADMVATGVVRDEGMIYFDARLAKKYPTVEIRVSDVCLHADTAVLVATLTRALVETAAREWREDRRPLDHSVSLLRLATFRAARSGVSEQLLHPLAMRPMPAEDVVRALLEHVQGALEDSGDLERARESAARVLHRGNGARLQREEMARSGNLGDVVAACVRHTQE